MKKPFLLSLAGLFLIVLSSALAVTLDVAGDTEVKVTSSYVWRGEVINDNACLQPSLRFFADPMSLQIWGTWDVEHTEESKERARMNFTIDYTQNNQGHIFRPGFVAYIYHDDYLGRAKDTFEIFLDYTIDVVLLPSFTVNYDFADIKGTYASAAIRHSVPLVKDKMNLDFRADLGWGDTRYVNEKFSLPKYAKPEDRTYEPNKSTLLDLTLSMALPMWFSEQVMFMPAVKYMHLLDSEIRDELDAIDANTDNFGGSLSLVVSF